jgi:thioredoxin 1
MHRLTEDSLPNFIAQPGMALVLFGASSGRPTLAQAQECADLWADRAAEIRFGHIDSLAHAAMAKTFAVRALPTMLVLRDGEVIAKLEGFHTRARLESALDARLEARAA